MNFYRFSIAFVAAIMATCITATPVVVEHREPQCGVHGESSCHTYAFEPRNH
ncbi:hypothetical protein K439DRAFT_1642249 [Ramaria rubella]|nr:hypothetical protein K439DRAFT_1642249 [Ramaria rubella]